MIGLFIKPVFYNVGTGDFFNSFFSTIYIKLENSNWGGSYPITMNNLYNGEVDKELMNKLKKELVSIQRELKKFNPNEIIWDFEDLTLSPPWGNNISSDIIDLSNYFVTSDGEDLFDVLYKAIDASVELNKNIIVKSL